MGFSVDQKVVYIGILPLAPGPAPGRAPTKGTIYTVSWIGWIDKYQCTQIDLAELPMPETSEWYRGYDARDFRPVVDSKVSVSFTEGAPLDSEHWDGRKGKVRA